MIHVRIEGGVLDEHPEFREIAEQISGIAPTFSDVLNLADDDIIIALVKSPIKNNTYAFSDGACCFEQRVVVVSIFDQKNNMLDVLEILEFISHEMIHMEQYDMGYLKYPNYTLSRIFRFFFGFDPKAVWKEKKVVFPRDIATDEDYEKYFNLPWEIDARERQKQVVADLFNFIIDKKAMRVVEA